MPDAPLDMIAASSATLADTQQIRAQSQSRHASLLLRLEDTQRFLGRLQAFAIGLLGLRLLGTGVLTWHLATHRVDSAALQQAVLQNSQIIEALLERLRQP